MLPKGVSESVRLSQHSTATFTGLIGGWRPLISQRPPIKTTSAYLMAVGADWGLWGSLGLEGSPLEGALINLEAWLRPSF